MKKNGFTLIELLVVISIIGLLATTVAAALQSARREARDTKRIADFKQIQNALQLYYDKNGKYPDTPILSNPYAVTSYTNPNDWIPDLVGTYIATLPLDPLNSVDKAWSGIFPPWVADSNNYNYQYTSFSVDGNQDYNLLAQLEDKNHPLRCENQCWTFNTDVGSNRNGNSWCSGSCPGGEGFDLDLFSDHMINSL